MPLDRDKWILEGIITTLDPRPPGASPITRVNIAPMGPIVDPSMGELLLRPFNTSTTFKNLKSTRQGVFHVTDDVLLLARAAIGRVMPDDEVKVRPADHVEGLVLTGACRYYELEVVEVDDRDQRTSVRASVVARGRFRDFFGFNRARHAVVESAILTTRLHLTGVDHVRQEFDRLQVIVEKTGSEREHQAMAELVAHVEAFALNQRVGDR